MSAVCPLSGAKRTKSKQDALSAYDPKRTSVAAFAAVHGRDLLYLIRDRVNWRTRVQAGPLRAAFFPGVYNVFNILQHKKFFPTPAPLSCLEISTMGQRDRSTPS